MKTILITLLFPIFSKANPPQDTLVIRSLINLSVSAFLRADTFLKTTFICIETSQLVCTKKEIWINNNLIGRYEKDNFNIRAKMSRY